jgi:TonB family protein
MSQDEAIAAGGGADLRRSNVGGDLSAVDGPASLEIGEIRFAPHLQFRSGRLRRITLGASGEVQNAEQCSGLFQKVVAATEPSVGVFAGAAADAEYGAPLDGQETPRGSRLRFYSFPKADVVRGHTNWRGQGFVEATSRYGAHPRAPAASRRCVIELTFEDTPYPVRATLMPPSTEQLERAAPISAPIWTERPNSRSYERTFPVTALEHGVSGRVELDCLVIEAGALNCAVAHEEPEDWYFGEAALRLSRDYRIALDGRATLGRRVRIAVPFNTGPPPGQSSAPFGATQADLDALRERATQGPTAAELAAAMLIQNPPWTAFPTGDVFGRYYPAQALEQNLSGRAVLECLVNEDGSLRCAVTEESPSGANFGLAALGIAGAFRLPQSIDGAPTIGKRVRVPIVFRLD